MFIHIVTLYHNGQKDIYRKKYQNKCSGPGCSKLMMSLVNVSLKFQMLIPEICQYFLWKKCEKLLIFSTKNFSVFGYKVVKHLTVELLTSLLS